MPEPAFPFDARTEARLAELRADVIGDRTELRGPFGPRRLVYADHIASGRPLARVERALRRSVLPTYANTHTEDSAAGARTTRLVHQAAAYLKARLGADERYALAYPGTGATGALKRLQEILGVAVSSDHRDAVLAALPPERRPFVVVGPYEHHSNEVGWRESLAEVVVAPLGPDGRIDLNALDAILGDPRIAGRPKIGAFSAASNVTGVVTDLPAVARVLRRHGAIVTVDFAAGAPYLPVDLAPGTDHQIDAVSISPHKLLGGPGACGLLAFRRDLYRLRAPTTAGGGTVAYVGPDAHRFVGDVEAREDAGTPGIVQRLRAAAAFREQERIGFDVIHARESAWWTRCLERLADHPGVRLLGPTDGPRLAIASFLLEDRGARDAMGPNDAGPVPMQHPRLVVRLLSDLFGIQGRAGCSCAGPYGHTLLSIDRERSGAYLRAIEAGYEGIKPGWSRISLHWSADRQEIEYLLDAVRFLADHGHRFAPLYAFDWRSGAWSWRGGPLAEALGLDPEPEGRAEPSEASEFDLEGLAAVPTSDEKRRDAYARAHREAAALAERTDALTRDPATASAVDAARPRVPDDVDRSLLFFRA